ncbi:MAG: lipoyl domain-containing protein [Actinomycetota bacterium]|jgi:pyruvate/2-oxoglutarate dehydrogenase complex dihydrolipoamide acyltransferase (E2) component|nr:lipoyl domain-containing protein [Actinomycetota bacterium]
MDVRFPQLSHQNPDLEGVLATWFVSDGQVVESDQLIAEVQVEKVSSEVTAPVSGRITLLVKEQDVVRQNSVIARID